MCDSVNHTRFSKEKHLPYWARRGNKDKKGDRVEHITFSSCRAYTVHIDDSTNTRWPPRKSVPLLSVNLHVSRFTETCQWLEIPLNGLRAQSRVSPAAGLLPLASWPACLGMAFPPFLVKQLYRCDSVVISSQIFEEACGYVRPERVNKWPNSMKDICDDDDDDVSVLDENECWSRDP